MTHLTPQGPLDLHNNGVNVDQKDIAIIFIDIHPSIFIHCRNRKQIFNNDHINAALPRKEHP